MSAKRRPLVWTAMLLVAGLAGGADDVTAGVILAGPADYRAAIARLRPGDALHLAPGTYGSGLILRDLHGEPGRPIVISGPSDRSAVFPGQFRHNTVELREVSYVEIRNLTLDGSKLPGVDGVKAQGVTHHITLENLEIVNHAGSQQTVGISTKAPAWNWVIRNNVIRGAGTGLYLGDSDGSAPFVHGLVEHNLIADPLGYGVQIKHQGPRPDIPGMPTAPGSTIIRYNIISKANQPRDGFQGPRPNLLVGHFPPSGAGMEDAYEIYGNLLYENLVGEPLFQGEGNIAFHDNLLINRHGDGLIIRPHYDRPRKVAVFHNTIVSKGAGIALVGGYPGFTQLVAGNAIFAERPVAGGERQGNLVAGFADAEVFLKDPFGDGADLDLRPRPGALRASGPDPALFAAFTDAGKDFAGNPRPRRPLNAAFPGAYAGPEVPREGPLQFPPAL